MAYTKQTWNNEGAGSDTPLNSSRLNHMEDGLLAGSLHGGGLPLVAASTATALIKSKADYVCTGSGDQTVINQALSETIGNGAGGVQLSGGIYFTSGPIIMGRAQSLMGSGMLTEIRATGNFQDAMIKNSANTDNMITIANVMINGDYKEVHGIRILNDSATFPQSGTGADRPGTNPDSVHWIHHVYVRTPGSPSWSGHGIYLGTSNGATGNSRGNKIHNCRVMDATGDAYHFDAASDSFVVDCLGTTRDGSGGAGFHVGGGSTKLTMCKTAYTNSHGFNIVSSRAQLTGCSAQDSGGHGYNIQSDAHLTGCQADSNGRLQSGGADGYNIAAADVMLEGCRALDRNQSAQRQRHGFNYVTGTNVYITGQAYNNTGQKINNSAGFQVASNYARIIGSGSVYSWG